MGFSNFPFQVIMLSFETLIKYPAEYCYRAEQRADIRKAPTRCACQLHILAIQFVINVNSQSLVLYILPKSVAPGGRAKKETATGVFPASEPLCIAQGVAANVPKFPRRHRSNTTPQTYAPVSPPSSLASSLDCLHCVCTPPIHHTHHIHRPRVHHVFGTTLPNTTSPSGHNAALPTTTPPAIDYIR